MPPPGEFTQPKLNNERLKIKVTRGTNKDLRAIYGPATIVIISY